MSVFDLTGAHLINSVSYGNAKSETPIALARSEIENSSGKLIITERICRFFTSGHNLQGTLKRKIL